MSLPINNVSPRRAYTAAAAQTTFDVPFEFFENTDLKVYRNGTLLALTTSPTDITEYSATGAGVEGGGSITLGAGATAGDEIVVLREVPRDRLTDFPLSGPFQINALNRDLDRFTAWVQEIEDKIGRSLRLSESDVGTIGDLPALADRLGKYLGFSAVDGRFVTVDGTDSLLGPDLASTDAGKGVELVAGAAKSIATRAAMKALTSAADRARPLYLAEGAPKLHGRMGTFIWNGSDLSTEVTADTYEAIYVAPNSDATGASGAWVRQGVGRVYKLDWFGPALDMITNDLPKIQAAIDMLPNGYTLLFPGGQSTAIFGGTIDFRNKGDCRFVSSGGRFRVKQLTANTPIIYYGASAGTLPQSGVLSGFNLLHATQQTNAQTNGNGLILYWSANAVFNDIYVQSCYHCIAQASDFGTAQANTVFDCIFDNIVAYGFTGYGFHLQPLVVGSTPNKIGRVYLNGAGQTAIRAFSLVGQDDYIEKLNIEFVKCSEALVYITGGGSSVRINKLYCEKANVTSAHRGLVYVGVNSVSIGQWQINSTTFDSADASTVYLATFFDGVINIGSFGIAGTTLTGPPTLQFLRAINGNANPAKQVRIGSISNPANVAIEIGDTRDTLVTTFDYPYPEQQTLAYAGTINPDFRKGWQATLALTGNITISTPFLNSRRKGKRATFVITQDATGGRTVTWSSDYVVNTSVNTAANAVTVVGVQWDGVKWREV